MVDIDTHTGLPAKEKISKMTVVLDKQHGGTELAEAEFNMTDFKFNEYATFKLGLTQCEQNTHLAIDPETTFLEIGLRGTKAKGLFASRRNSSRLSAKH